MKRYAGVLLPVTSLPSKYGIGCFDQAAYDFVDWLQKAGQRYWQILPLGATSYGSSDDSPYQAYSAFAGNPYLISLDALVEEVNEQDPSLLTGRLSNNTLVHFPGDASLIGKIVNVRLEKCHGFYYTGTVTEE